MRHMILLRWAVLLVLGLAWGTPAANAQAAGQSYPFSLPSGWEVSSNLVATPDGAIWFAESSFLTPTDPPVLVRISPTTGASTIALPASVQSVAGLAVTSDGSVWFTEAGRPSAIGRMQPSGALTQYPTVDAGFDEMGPGGIVVGPDGAIWFTVAAGIERVDMSGRLQFFPIPASEAPGQDLSPQKIAVGPDGALWFTTETNRIGRITTTGEMSLLWTPVALTGDLVAGSDGALWVSGGSGINPDAVQRITTQGVYSEVAVGTVPADLAPGPDGALWFDGPGIVGRVGSAGPTVVGGPGLAVGQMVAAGDGAMWLLGQRTLYRLAPGVVPTAPVPSVAPPPPALPLTSVAAGHSARGCRNLPRRAVRLQSTDEAVLYRIDGTAPFAFDRIDRYYGCLRATGRISVLGVGGGAPPELASLLRLAGHYAAYRNMDAGGDGPGGGGTDVVVVDLATARQTVNALATSDENASPLCAGTCDGQVTDLALGAGGTVAWISTEEDDQPGQSITLETPHGPVLLDDAQADDLSLRSIAAGRVSWRHPPDPTPHSAPI
jgi:virginiamycin B lyase